MAKPKVKIKDKDKKYKALKKQIAIAKKSAITVGIHDAEGSIIVEDEYSNTKTILDIAILNHFGGKTESGNDIPARPFITQWVDSNKARINSNIKKVSEMIIKGMPAEKALELYGQWAVGEIKKNITQNKPFEPNSEYTIQKKGSSTPLVDDGQLIASITYKITKK